MSILSLHDITKSFGPLEILKGVSFEIEAGDSVAITGPSGSGKSTLLHILGTLDTLGSGQLEIEGIDPAGLSEVDLAKFRNERIGFVFQDAYLLPQFSVIENTIMPVRAFESVTGADRERARGLLSEVGLGEREDHLPGQLSGGERQRAAIARSLVMNPRLLLCDEPTGNLDARTAEQIADTLLRSGAGDDRALVVTTHSETLAQRMSRRFELRDGQCFEV
jgi:lipoprotein-releasing system ATP-binding protein